MEKRSIPGKRRIALTVRYDGTAFHGFQRQINGNTVQAELEKALSVLLREKITVFAAGRTDSGVHALGQVIHFDTTSDLSLRRIAIGLNGILPRSISVSDVFHVGDDFHARFSAVSRSYRYCIYNHPYRSPFADRRALWYPRSIDTELLNQACSYLVGEHDFTSLCRPGKNNTRRRIISASVQKNDCDISVLIRADSFLHNMIRIITGTLLDINERSLPPEHMSEVIERKDRRCAGETAPPWGLYFENVEYLHPLSDYPSATDGLSCQGL